MKRNKISICLGFTLAEVLITLGVIGVVCAMTIPTLMANNQKDTTVTRLKSVYSILNQAYLSSVNDNGEKAGWSWGTTSLSQADTTNVVETYILPYLKVAKNCGFTAYGTCFGPGKTYLNNSDLDYYNGYQVALNNGICIDFKLEYDSGVSTLELFVDINGNSSPNKMGKDIFLMTLYSNDSKPIKFYGQGIDRNTLLTHTTWGCNNSPSVGQAGTFCGALILGDGWQIKDDYPW